MLIASLLAFFITVINKLTLFNAKPLPKAEIVNGQAQSKAQAIGKEREDEAEPLIGPVRNSEGVTVKGDSTP